MAKDQRQVDAITARDVDFAQWFTDVCKKAELIDYSSIKGMFIYRPYGYAIWENMQKELDRQFKASAGELLLLGLATLGHGHGQVVFAEIGVEVQNPDRLLHGLLGGGVHSVALLPQEFPVAEEGYNQWCSVLRWEKTSRPFLRHREFLWQEGC